MAWLMQSAAACLTASEVKVAPATVSISALWASSRACWKSAAESRARSMVSLEVSTVTSVMEVSVKVMVTVTSAMPVALAV